eukprot:jgi/Tetstr1/465047/TSEL_009775.t1
MKTVVADRRVTRCPMEKLLKKDRKSITDFIVGYHRMMFDEEAADSISNQVAWLVQNAAARNMDKSDPCRALSEELSRIACGQKKGKPCTITGARRVLDMLPEKDLFAFLGTMLYNGFGKSTADTVARYDKFLEVTR